MASQGFANSANPGVSIDNLFPDEPEGPTVGVVPSLPKIRARFHPDDLSYLVHRIRKVPYYYLYVDDDCFIPIRIADIALHKLVPALDFWISSGNTLDVLNPDRETPPTWRGPAPVQHPVDMEVLRSQSEQCLVEYAAILLAAYGQKVRAFRMESLVVHAAVMHTVLACKQTLARQYGSPDEFIRPQDQPAKWREWTDPTQHANQPSITGEGVDHYPLMLVLEAALVWQ